jgi:hypothetical protein
LSTNGSGTLAFGTLGILGGGTGLTSTPANGALDIGNGTGFTRTTLTAGSNVTITNGAGSITIAASGGSASAATPTALGTVYGATPASNNVSLGYNSGNGGSYNTFAGNTAGQNTTGSFNNAYGQNALTGATPFSANRNDAFGYASLSVISSGAHNACFGFLSGASTSSGSYNSCVGSASLQNVTTGFQNTCVGWKAGTNMTTGSRTVCVGDESGLGLTTGQLCVYVGGAATPSSATVNYEMVIGAGTGKGSSTGYIIPAGGGAAVYQGNNSSTWSTTSDRRLKKNIVDNNTGLDKITAIQVRNFEYRLANEITDLPQDQAIDKAGVQLGVIAQELQAVLPDCIKTESTGVMSVNSDNLTWYMINAIKELKAEVDSLKSQLNQGT